VSSPAFCLKTTGAREIVPGVESLLDEVSRRLAYSERPGRKGFATVSGAMVVKGKM